MKSNLYIHLHDSAGESASWASLEQGEQRPQEVHRGQLDAIPQPDENTRVTVFVPATDVLLTRVTIPSRSRKQLASAAPYVLEDQLIDDIEDMHFALGTTGSDGTTSVATVANEKLEHWLSRMRENNIHVDAVFSEAQALPVNDRNWSVLHLGDRCILRDSANSGYGVDCDNLGYFVEQLARSGDNPPERISVIACDGHNAGSAGLEGLGPVSIENRACPGDAIICLIEGSETSPGINLLQGRFTRSRAMITGLRRWIPAMILLLLWVGIQFGTLVYDNIALSAEQQALREETVALYRQAAPGAKKVVNARVQMQQLLDSLQGGGADSGFLDLLARGGEVFSRVPGVELNTISYRDGSMDIALVLKDLQGLDNIKQSLVEKLGVEVDIQSATPKDKVIEARLRIRRKP